MCEHFIARAAEPFRLDDLWPFVEKLERFGIAGFGWGAAWLASDAGQRLGSYRDVRAFRDDPGREDIGANETTSALIHVRRPTKLSTLTIEDTQPFDDPDGRFSFSHNGDLKDYKSLRPTFQAQGRIHGKADTEVGARWLEDAWHADAPGPHLLARLHARFGGKANLALISADGESSHYAGNSENPVFTFRLGRIGIASTGIYSLDRSVFRFAAQGATDRRLLPIGSTITLDHAGRPSAAG